MRADYQKSKVLARGKEVFMGIDVHKESWQVTVCAEGEELFTGRLPSEYHALEMLISRFPKCGVKAAYEAGPCGFRLHDQLVAAGIETIVVPPSLIPVESGNRVKTDKRDSRKLAHLLERNMLKRVHVLSEEERADRELLRTRRQILEHRSDVLRQIKSKLLFHGIKIPFSTQRTWTRKYVRWLNGLTLENKTLRLAFDYLIDLCDYLTEQLSEINEKIAEMAGSEKYAEKVQLLKSVPGIGTLIALEMLVELQDVRRFKSADRLASYIGLTPSEYSTGQYVRQGRITRCGNKRVRTCAVEASWMLITKDPRIRARYDRLKRMKGGKRAIIAIARNLMTRIRRILIDSEPYALGAAA